jgi:hypothetical protein
MIPIDRCGMVSRGRTAPALKIVCCTSREMEALE